MYGDSAGNTVEENSSVFSLIRITSCLQCFDTVGWATGRASGLYKMGGDGGDGHWLVRMELHLAGLSVCLPLHHKVLKFSCGTGSPGRSRKKGRKTVVVVVVYFVYLLILIGLKSSPAGPG